MDEVLPDNLLGIENLDAFLAHLKGLPIDPEDKRLMLIDWADGAGIKVTGAMVKKAGID